MQLLSRPPGAAIAVFPQMLHDQADVLQMPDLGLGMAEPETLRVRANQFAGPLDECRRFRHCGRHLVGLFGRPSHPKWLATGGGSGKAAVALLPRRSLAIRPKYRALKVHPPTAISRGAETASSGRFLTRTSKTQKSDLNKNPWIGGLRGVLLWVDRLHRRHPSLPPKRSQRALEKAWRTGHPGLNAR